MQTDTGSSIMESTKATLLTNRFAFVPGAAFALSSEEQFAWQVFASHWNDLPLDEYLPTIGRYRRYNRFLSSYDGTFKKLPTRPYFQSSTHNPLVGGMQRHFEELPADFALSPQLRRLIEYNVSQLRPLEELQAWEVHVHMVRLCATEATPGQPSPEGLHSDGFEFVSMHLLSRCNVSGADTIVTDASGEELFHCTLSERLDSLLLDDRQVMHYTSPFVAVAAGDSYRDMLLMSYNCSNMRDLLNDE